MNWKNIITELRLAGFSQRVVAQTVGCGQASISDLATNKSTSPNYEIGAKLVAMHKKHRKAIASALTKQVSEV